MSLEEQKKDLEETLKSLESTKSCVESQIEDINNQIKEAKNPKFNEPWKPKKNEKYYSLEIDGECFLFKNVKELEQRAKEIKVYNLLKNFSDANGGNHLNWSKPSQEKYYIHYDYDDLSFAISFDYSTKCLLEIYFISYEVAEEALRLYKTELEELVK